VTPRIHLPAIYCISEGDLTDENFDTASARLLSIIGAAASSDISMFQIREKALSAARLFEFASEAVRVTAGSPLKILVNGRADIALAAGAAGVHLPVNGVPVEAVRKWVPDEFIIGASTHSTEEASAARDGGADFVVFGPVFETPGKGPAAGLKRLKAVAEALAPFPVIALGGIDDSNLHAVKDSGAAGLAAIRYLNSKLANDLG